ncbi:glycosyltransferase family 2 protein [Humibacillus xanthopallidus]|uniref:Glycosyl transferase family 2 n=1 Tax=Humibacillus xanthopallidus TaxID=412689 RepID=A0A543I1Q1_9MICO|nr:glycosyltransferase family 2 protein [Humibacillus xanthopallidus]TQM64524.1 glycosyl transferase family 2 [Humibacillus xanthopallidus]
MSPALTLPDVSRVLLGGPAVRAHGRTTLSRLGQVCALTGVGTIAYVLVGYPAVIMAWSRLKGEKTSAPPFVQPVSIVISAHNEAEVIGPKLESLAHGNYPLDQLQVIVSDDGSTDGTADVVRSVAPWAQIVRVRDRTGKMGAMQRAMRRVRHDIVVFTDAENILDPHALTELLTPFCDPDVGAVNGAFRPVGGSETVGTGERLYWRYEDAIKRAEANVGSLTSILGALFAIRTDLVPQLPVQLINDDFFLGMHVARRGFKVAYASGAVTWESGAASLTGDAVRRARMTAGRWQTVRHWREILPIHSPVVMWQVLSHKYLRLALPLAMGAALVGSAAEVMAQRSGSRGPTRAQLLLGAQLGGYAMALAADRIPSELGPLRGVAQALRYLVRSNLASAEGFWKFLRTPEDLALWDRVDKIDRAA